MQGIGNYCYACGRWDHHDSQACWLAMCTDHSMISTHLIRNHLIRNHDACNHFFAPLIWRQIAIQICRFTEANERRSIRIESLEVPMPIIIPIPLRPNPDHPSMAIPRLHQGAAIEFSVFTVIVIFPARMPEFHWDLGDHAWQWRFLCCDKRCRLRGRFLWRGKCRETMTHCCHWVNPQKTNLKGEDTTDASMSGMQPNTAATSRT